MDLERRHGGQPVIDMRTDDRLSLPGAQARYIARMERRLDELEARVALLEVNEDRLMRNLMAASAVLSSTVL